MDRDELLNQAVELEGLLPRLARRLFTIDLDDPASELPVAQLRVCSVLRAGPESMSMLGAELGISTSAITQLADRLERAGLVERISEVDDRRIRKLVLTEHGRDIMAQRWETRVGRARMALGALPEDRRADVLKSLRELLSVTVGDSLAVD